MDSNKSEYITVAQACALLVSPVGRPAGRGQLGRWIKVGVNGRKLPTCKWGRRVYLRRDDVIAFGRFLNEQAGVGV